MNAQNLTLNVLDEDLDTMIGTQGQSWQCHVFPGLSRMEPV